MNTSKLSKIRQLSHTMATRLGEFGAFRRKQMEFAVARAPITFKLSLIIALLITATMAMLGLFLINNQSHLLRSQIQEFGSTVVNQLADSSRELVLSDDLLSLMVLVSNLGKNENILGVEVYSDRGTTLASSGAIPAQDILQQYNQAVATPQGYYTREWQLSSAGGEQEVISFISPIRFQKLIVGHALVTFSKSALTYALHKTIQVIIGASLFMLFLSVVAAFLISRRISKPIHYLMDASKALESGDLNYRIAEQRYDEIGYLIGAFNKMAGTMLEKNQVEQAFSRFVSPKVARQIMDNLDHIQLGGKHVMATALFADIVGFTSMSEKQPPTEVAAMLNEYYSYIEMASRLYHGTIDKYMGDCAMIVFGVPENDPEHRFNAVACAVMIQRLIARINVQRAAMGKPMVNFRIGINSGEMLAGNLGSLERMQYSVVGDAVNLASRLQNAAESGQILVTDNFVKDPEVQWRIVANRHLSIMLRGFADPVTTYIITDLQYPYHESIDRQIDEILTNRIVA